MTQEFAVILEILKKPTELPKCLFRAVQPPVEGSFLHGLRFEDDEAEFEEGLFRLPAKDSAIASPETGDSVPGRRPLELCLAYWLIVAAAEGAAFPAYQA